MSEKRYISWPQRKISDWATEKFGWHGPLPIAIRGNKEMAELISALQNDKMPAIDIVEECADVTIFLLQICERLGFDLIDMVDAKMNKNDKRTWTVGKDGSHQHVEEKEDRISQDHKIQFIKSLESGDSYFVCMTCGSRDNDLDKTCPGF